MRQKISSTTERIGGIHVCVYCCAKAQIDFYYDEYDRTDVQYCTCEKAKKEIEINTQLQELSIQKHNLLQSKDDSGLNFLRFQRDVSDLKRKYGVK